MHVESIPMRWHRGDNYAYLLIDDETLDSWLIDPAEPKDVINYLQLKKDDRSVRSINSAPAAFNLPANYNLSSNLKAIVNTHHHYDHAGGNPFFSKLFPNLPIIAGKDSNLVSLVPSDNQVFKLGNNIEITAIHTPCHTVDSICYFATDLKTRKKVAFTGDTLFTAGCGRFFEGNGEDMDNSLNVKLKTALPKDTIIYPGHEYTKDNIKFAKSVLKNNLLLSFVESQIKDKEYTTGLFTIEDEINFNPFMRIEDEEVLIATNSAINSSQDRFKIMDKLREMKNNFKS
ncbi:hydroxyacylglutathione hydrolase [Ascoidea rubescens DSM 1968]|uniref:hydroxyacylglutathione hydrolase n=1 Tax=Ascoidea rubescens DSM 1968 TaxID=1344418 RepID=A0A1D2VCY1_9ASCO|nr:Metallo-hydrolase/oxidoreductase [Ascoidea rubescens DSM 1968]ODV59486.1 Metallo-hydrolase/oxidoreductase [Ascoidea rubescens DSM 1968]